MVAAFGFFGCGAKLIELKIHEAHLKCVNKSRSRNGYQTQTCVCQRHINNLSEINWLTGKINKLSAELNKCWKYLYILRFHFQSEMWRLHLAQNAFGLVVALQSIIKSSYDIRV